MATLSTPTAPARRLSRKVRDALAERMYRLELLPGDDLPSESALAGEYGVSKPVIREALSELAALQVVEIRQGRATTVCAVTAAPLTTLFDLAVCASGRGLGVMLELRLAIECQAAAAAALRRTPDQVAKLQAITAALAANMRNAEDWNAANWQFHLAISEASGNELFTLIFRALERRIREGQRMLFSQHYLRDPNQTLARHVDVYQAIADQDAEAARVAMQRHFTLALHVASLLDRC